MWRKIWQNRGLWLRLLFCWAIGVALPRFDEAENYDIRFKLRGRQSASPEIVLVTFDQADWKAYHGASENWLRAIKEFAIPTDSFFWKSSTWDILLGQILKQNPRKIAVTFFFSQQLPTPDLQYVNLYSPKVLWAGQVDSEGRPVMPLMANGYGYNVAITDMRQDEDHVVRRFSGPVGPLPHMALAALDDASPEIHQRVVATFDNPQPINFRGLNVFPTISALDVLNGRIPNGFFAGKIVFIGNANLQSHQFQTPVGRLSRIELLAHVADNVLADRWVKRLPLWIYAIYILVVLIVAVSILNTYPQTVAFVFLLWVALGVSALSLYVFDSLYVWLPVISPLVTLLAVYVIMIGYQLTVKENQNWRLEQETKLLSELDQLRNNFVSLISHDLKTPIAKIQAICDRLLAGQVSDDVREGLSSLRRESMELHRYIQSILHLSRLESNSVQLRKEATDFNEVVENVVEQIRPLAADKRQELRLNLEPMFSIEVDGVMIQEVVLNLIENAVKYTPNDGRIEVETQEVDDKVIFTVRDSGPGIPPQDREHIFEKFFRGSMAQTKTKGTGLGLFLVKYFVELHGGEVFLESDIGKGTRVGFTLPLQA